MTTTNTNTTIDFEITDETIAEMTAHHSEFVTARDKFVAGEISEAELGEYINLKAWKQSYLSSAKQQVMAALVNLGFQDIRFARGSFITSDDLYDSLTPRQLQQLIWSQLDCQFILQIGIKRDHGRVRYNIHLLSTKSIFEQIKAENETADEPLTEDVELKFHERNKDADFEMGRTYMYVFDAFHEVYGVYPEQLSNHEDYARLGRMVNLALAGECFDI